MEYCRYTETYDSHDQEMQERAWLWHTLKRKISKEYRPVWIYCRSPPTSLTEFMGMIDLFFHVLPKLVVDEEFGYQLRVGRNWDYQ